MDMIKLLAEPTVVDGYTFTVKGGLYFPAEDPTLALRYEEIGAWVEYMEQDRQDVNSEGNTLDW